MKKIKILVLFLIVVLLCQNISFCIPEASFALRPPLVTNQTDFVASDELKIDMGGDFKEQSQRIDTFLGSYAFELEADLLSIVPHILYKNREVYPTLSAIPSRLDLFDYVLSELDNNLRDYSNGNNSELYIQLGHYKENGLAIRIVSRNKEKIEEFIDIFNGAKIKLDERKEDVVYKRVGLLFLKEFAFNNQGIVFIIDSNGHRVSVSEDSITSNRGIYPGTEVQMIISIPFQSDGGLLTTSIKRAIYPRNEL